MNSVTIRRILKLLGSIFVFLVLFGEVNPVAAQPILNFKRLINNWPTIEVYFFAQCNGRPVYFPDSLYFSIRENGVPITNFTYWAPPPAEPPDVSTGLVIDGSASMSSADLQSAKDYAHTVVGYLSLGHDEGALITFNDSVTIRQPMTGDFSLLHAAIDGISSAGNSAVWDGIHAAVGHVATYGGNECRNVVAFTNGPGTADTAQAPARAVAVEVTPVIAGPASSPTNGPAAFSAASTDPEGAPLTWNWLLVSRPAGSLAALSGSGNAAILSPDVAGSYLVGVRASDGTDNSILAVHAYAAGFTPPPPATHTSGGGCAVPPRGAGNSTADGLVILAAILLVRATTSRRESSRS